VKDLDLHFPVIFERVLFKKTQQSLLYYSTITLYYLVNRDVEDV